MSLQSNISPVSPPLPCLPFDSTHPQRRHTYPSQSPSYMVHTPRNRASTNRPCSRAFPAASPDSAKVNPTPPKTPPANPVSCSSSHAERGDSDVTAIPRIQLHLQLDQEYTRAPRFDYNTEAWAYSSQFPPNHHLNTAFVQTYQLEDELGSGGYGFVMTAYHRIEGDEVAVKFIIKDKVPEHAWTDDPVSGRLPTEVALLNSINHPNIVKCLAVFEDNLYFYLVQELHGSPWHKDHKLDAQPLYQFADTLSPTPSLSPSSSETSLPSSEPTTPLNSYAILQPVDDHLIASNAGNHKFLHCQLSKVQESARPEFTRRASHDLFECIEQSEHKKLTECQARFVFSQVVDAVKYLHDHEIVHRDIKDENLVIDKCLKVKLIDFGSAIAFDPSQPRPYYQTFCGTAAYASSEILLKKEYQAAPAEIWTLGILLSYLLAGVSPFPTARDAVDGRIFLSEKVVGKIPEGAMDLMQMCLDPNPETRATIFQVKEHPWLQRQKYSHL